ncbi:MAG: ATP-dependent DNA ligase, partial [Pseudomonadota bacterium]
MNRFAELLEALVYTTSRNRKLALLSAYLREVPDPDRGWALAALTGELDFPAVKSSTIRGLMKDRVDPVLWTLSRDFVGDTAETASLLWPEPKGRAAPKEDAPGLSETVGLLSKLTRATAPKEL